MKFHYCRSYSLYYSVIQLPHITHQCADDTETCSEHSQDNSISTSEAECRNPGPLQCREVEDHHHLSAKAPASLSDNGNSDGERACFCENIDPDYGAQVNSIAGGKLEDSSDSLQNSSEGKSAAPSCGKEQAETDRAPDLICESSKGPEKEVQEEEGRLVRTDEDQHLELSAEDMGITQSAGTPESSDVESCSQGEESHDESEGGNGNSSSLEQEEMEERNDDSAMDNSGNGKQESSEADLQSESPCISVDMIHQVADKHDINASQTNDSYELGPQEQEKTAQGNTDAQEEDTLDISCHDPETESSNKQFDVTCYHRQESDTTPEETCQKNEMVGELQTLLDAEANPCSSGFELDGTSSVTLNTICRNRTHSPEPEPEEATGEPVSTVVSETTEGSESEGQILECGTGVSLAVPGTEPDSSSPSSEDTLDPEETEQVSANMVQTVCSSDPQEVLQQSSFNHDRDHIQVSEEREYCISLENDDWTREITLTTEDELSETGDTFLLKNSEVPEQGDRAVSPSTLISEDTVELSITEVRLIISEQEVQPCLDLSEEAHCNFSNKNLDHTSDSLLSLDEQSRLRSEDRAKSEVVDTDSAVTELPEKKETQEKDVDGHSKTHQEGEKGSAL